MWKKFGRTGSAFGWTESAWRVWQKHPHPHPHPSRVVIEEQLRAYTCRIHTNTRCSHHREDSQVRARCAVPLDLVSCRKHMSHEDNSTDCCQAPCTQQAIKHTRQQSRRPPKHNNSNKRMLAVAKPLGDRLASLQISTSTMISPKPPSPTLLFYTASSATRKRDWMLS